MTDIHKMLKGFNNEMPEFMDKESHIDVEGFNHLWAVTLQWMVLNSKKKLSAKVRNRLACLDAISSSLHSKVLRDSSAIILHCIELCAIAMRAKSDKEFLEDISAFTNAEACGMLKAFYTNAKASVHGTVNYCIENKRLVHFLNVAGVSDAVFPDIPELSLRSLKDSLNADVPDVLSLDLNGEFKDEFGTKFNALQNALQSVISLCNDKGASSINDMTFTMVVNFMLLLACKISALPVVKDSLEINDSVNSLVKTADTVSSKEEADRTLRDAVAKKDDTESCYVMLSYIANQFAVNNILALWDLASSMPDLEILKKSYNDAGLLLHDGEGARMVYAEWSRFTASFYNTIADFFTDLGFVHEDISSTLATHLKKKKKPHVIDLMLSGEAELEESFSYMSENLPIVAIAASKGDKPKENTVTKKARRGKKLPK